MPVNRNALIRFKTIDKCLQNRYRRWTLEDLIDACSDALYEYEGIGKGVSRRSIQADIQMMRSDKLGYNAPIIVVDKKYYTYEDAEYSITNIPITEQDLGKLTEAVEFLKQFKGFSHFRELDGMVQKLEDHVYSQKTHQKPVIDFEKNEYLKGIDFLDDLYQAIVEKRTLTLTYQSFKARQANTFNFYPYLLKEFRNRWFLIGCRNKNESILTLALDRIIEVAPSNARFWHDDSFDPETYFRDVIGVSASPTVKPDEVIFFVNHKHAPYVITKPFHWSQKVVERDNYGVIFSMRVQHNFELEKEILGLGEAIKVIAPEKLKRNIRIRLQGAMDMYDTDINENGLKTAVRKMQKNGFFIFNHVYTNGDLRRIGMLVDQYIKETGAKPYGIRELVKQIPALWPVLFNRNLQRLVNQFDADAFLCKSIYFDKTPEANWAVGWHQDISIHVAKKKNTEGFTGWTHKDGHTGVCAPAEVLKEILTLRIHLDDTGGGDGALNVIPGTQNKILTPQEIDTISENSIPVTCEVPAGGVQLMRPLLLHGSQKSRNGKHRRVIHLEFSSKELPNGLEWGEKQSFEF